MCCGNIGEINNCKIDGCFEEATQDGLCEKHAKEVKQYLVDFSAKLTKENESLREINGFLKDDLIDSILRNNKLTKEIKELKEVERNPEVTLPSTIKPIYLTKDYYKLELHKLRISHADLSGKYTREINKNQELQKQVDDLKAKSKEESKIASSGLKHQLECKNEQVEKLKKQLENLNKSKQIKPKTLSDLNNRCNNLNKKLEAKDRELEEKGIELEEKNKRLKQLRSLLK